MLIQWVSWFLSEAHQVSKEMASDSQLLPFSKNCEAIVFSHLQRVWAMIPNLVDSYYEAWQSMILPHFSHTENQA